MEKVEIFENERASNYENFVQTWILGYDEFLKIVPQILKEEISKELLVVGCGTGNEIGEFLKINRNWKITGVDPSFSMIEQARARFGKCSNVTLILDTVSNLDKGLSFDVGTLFLVLHFLKDNGEKLTLLRNIGQNLSLGAKFVLFDITGDKDHINNNLEILKLLLPDAMDKEEIELRLERIKNELFWVSDKRLEELLVEAGFKKPTKFFQSSIYAGWITEKIG